MKKRKKKDRGVQEVFREKAQLIHSRKYLSILAGLIFLVAFFSRTYNLNNQDVIYNEDRYLFRGVDFTLSLFYHFKQGKVETRSIFRSILPEFENLHVKSPFPYSPYYKLGEFPKLEPYRVKWKFEFGGDRDMLVPKSFANMGIQSRAPGTPIGFLDGISYLLLGKGTSSLSLNLLPPLTAARLPNVILGVLTCLIFFYFIRFITDSNEIAFLSSLLLALEPSFVALSRDLKTDMSIATFSLATLFFYFYGKETGKKVWFHLSGACFGLAIATKQGGLALPLSIALYLFIEAWRECPPFQLKKQGKKWQKFKKWRSVSGIPFFTLTLPLESKRERHINLPFPIRLIDLLIFLEGLIVFIVLFPNLWGNPLTGLIQNFKGQEEQITGAVRYAFFLGQPVTEYPWYWYLVILPIHFSEIFLFSLLGGLVFLARDWRGKEFSPRFKRGVVFLATWSIFYFFIISRVGSIVKKVATAAPLYFFFAFLGGYFLWEMRKFGLFKKLKKSYLLVLVSILILIVNGSIFFTYYPHFMLFYNRLFMTPEKAMSMEWISGDHTSGAREVGEFVKADGGGAVVSLSNPEVFSLYVPKCYEAPEKSLKLYPIKYIVVELWAVQRGYYPQLAQYLAQFQPAHTVIENGVPVVKIYRVDEVFSKQQ